MHCKTLASLAHVYSATFECTSVYLLLYEGNSLALIYSSCLHNIRELKYFVA